MDLNVLSGVVGALGGVSLGAWLSDRSQRRLLRESQRLELQQRREAAYVEFLASHRQFRRFLLTEPVEVILIPSEVEGDTTQTPVVDGSLRHWESVESSAARVHILAETPQVLEAARGVANHLYEVARARATHRPGAVPWDVVRAARAAEDAFVEAAKLELAKRD